jgi:hypothetical protein
MVPIRARCTRWSAARLSAGTEDLEVQRQVRVMSYSLLADRKEARHGPKDEIPDQLKGES